MAHEIERKFLVENTSWRQDAEGIPYRQGYLHAGKAPVVRVRISGDMAFLTIKGPTRGVTRAEFEYPVPMADAERMLEMFCRPQLVEKIRYRIPFGRHLWEVDEFLGENAGLVLAEVELDSEDEPFERPDWLGREVSDDPRYFNNNLLTHPYRKWGTQP